MQGAVTLRKVTWAPGRVDVTSSLGTSMVVQSRGGLVTKAGPPESQVSSSLTIRGSRGTGRGRGQTSERNLKIWFLGFVLPLPGWPWLDKSSDLPKPRLFHPLHGVTTSCPARPHGWWLWGTGGQRIHGPSKKVCKYVLQLFFIICW